LLLKWCSYVEFFSNFSQFLNHLIINTHFFFLLLIKLKFLLPMDEYPILARYYISLVKERIEMLEARLM